MIEVQALFSFVCLVNLTTSDCIQDLITAAKLEARAHEIDKLTEYEQSTSVYILQKRSGHLCLSLCIKAI